MPDVHMRDARSDPSRAPKIKKSVGMIADHPTRAAEGIEQIIYQVTRYIQREPHKIYNQCKVWEMNARSRWVLNYCQWNKQISDMSLVESCFVAMCYAYMAFTPETRQNFTERRAAALHVRIRMMVREWREFAPEHLNELDCIFPTVCSIICFSPIPTEKGNHIEVNKLFEEKKQDEAVLRPPDMDNQTYLDELRADRTQGNEAYSEARLLDSLLEGEIGDSITDFHPGLLTEDEMLALDAMEKPMVTQSDDTAEIPKRRKQFKNNIEVDDDDDSDFEDHDGAGVSSMQTDEKGVVTEDGLQFDMDAETNAITIHDTIQMEEKYIDYRLPEYRKKLSLYSVDGYSAKNFVKDACRLYYWYEVRKLFLARHEVINTETVMTRSEEDRVWYGLTAAAQIETSDLVQRAALEFFVRCELPVGAIDSFLRQRPMSRWSVSISDVLEHESSHAHHKHIIEIRTRDVPMIMRRDKQHPMRTAWTWILWHRFFVSYLGVEFARALPIKPGAVPPKENKRKNNTVISGVNRNRNRARQPPVVAPGTIIGEREEYDPSYFVFFDDIPERWDKILTLVKHDERRRPLIIAMDDVYWVQNVRMHPKGHPKAGQHYRELHRCKDAVMAINTWVRIMREQFNWLLADGKSVKEVWERFVKKHQDVPSR